jgi:NhaP-type Na+/H+ or K+/H+ antiporter
VILVTLVVQGLTLPALINRLGVEEDDAEEREELAARRAEILTDVAAAGEIACWCLVSS